MNLNPPEPRGPLEGDGSTPSEPRLLTRRDPSDLNDSAEAPRSRWKPPTERPPKAKTSNGHNGLFAALDRLQRKQIHDAPELARTPRRRRRFPLRKIFIAWAVLSAVAVVALITTALWLRHSMRAALPQLDGTLHVAGLTAPVTVTRDVSGVPSIHAATLDDALFAQGYVTAQDRLWQMDIMRRHSAGQLAEILGSSVVEEDRRQRILQLAAAVDRAIAVIPPDQLHQLEDYSRGVNAFMASHPDTLPIEFHLLHYTPARWTPRDSLLVSLGIWQALSSSFPSKLNREALVAHLPPELIPDLYPVGSFRDRPPSQPPPDLTQDRGEIPQVPLDESQSSLHRPARPFATPQDLLHAYDALRTDRCDACRAGSNNWAVSAARSASGSPLVSNDMHLSLSVPAIWYEVALHVDHASPAFDVTGFTLPGVPFVITGRNAHVAWGFTSLGGDVQDVRIEHLRGSGASTEFERPDGAWSPVVHHPELIRVRGGRDVKLDVLTTSQTVGSTEMPTPIISPLYPTEHRALSLAWTLYDPSTINAPFAAVNAATDGASLVAAFSTFGGPTLNLIYADDARHIGYHALGRIPIRGPATEHQREIPQEAIPYGAPPPDEDADESQADSTQPDAAQTAPDTAPDTSPELPTEATPAPSLHFSIGSPISAVPVDALDISQQWSGYIPYDQLPSTVDPANGILATANSRITPDDYPYAVTDDWVDAYRVERIDHLLSNRTGLTPADMLAVQNDVHSALDLMLAQRLAYAVDHALTSAISKDTTRLRQAADLLRKWNGNVSSDSSAAAIALAVRDQLWPLLLTPQIAAHDHINANDDATHELANLYTWGERNSALEKILNHTPARWLPPGFADWNDFLTVALARALHTANAPHDLTKWHYGQYHPVEIAHPVLGSHSIVSRILGVATGTGRQPAPGNGITVRASGLHFGPSERFTADLSDPEATTANITTGQSENPDSPWFLDQFLPWLHGTTLPLPLNHPATAHTLTLIPN
jgi:penicillin amidase